MTRSFDRLLRWLGRWAGHRFFGTGLGILAAFLCLPALWVGLQLDDYFLVWMLRGSPGAPELALPWWEAFRFADGNPTRIGQMMEAGILPWWSHPELRIAGFRPIAALTHLLDVTAWGASPALMHLQSLLWLGVLVVAVSLLYRKLLGATAVGALAALLFALDDAHGFAAGWLAQRNALVGATFGLFALLAHDRWRRDHDVRAGLAAPPLLALGLLSADSSLGVLTYFGAHALFLEQGRLLRRVRGLVPAALVALLWLVLNRITKSGAFACDFYLDPRTQPLEFLAATVVRAPALLAGQWTLLPAELGVLLPDRWVPAHAFASLLLLVPIAVVALPRWRGAPVARFFATGMLGTLVLACGAPPMDRLLLLVGVGAAGLTATLLTALHEKAALTFLERTVFLGLIVTHLVVSPLLLPARALSPAQRIYPFGSGMDSLPPELAGQHLVIVRAPDPFSAGLVPLHRTLAGEVVPNRTRLLSATRGALEVRRLDDRTLLLDRPDGRAWEEIVWVRDATVPLRKGDRVHLQGMEAQVERVDFAGRIVAASVSLDRSLDEPVLRWGEWRDQACVPFVVPAVGSSVVLPEL